MVLHIIELLGLMPLQEFLVSDTSFASLALSPALLATLDSLGYHQMTPVQAQSLPPMLAGRDRSEEVV